MNQGRPAYSALVNNEEESRPTQQPMAGQVQPTPDYPTFQQQGNERMIPGVGQPAAFYVCTCIMTNHEFNLSHVDATISTNYHALSQLCYTNT